MSDELVKRLRELRSKQYADLNTAPEFVFLDPDLPPKEWEKQYAMDVIYVRADRIEELEAKLADAAAALKEIFDGKNWRLGQKFDPNSGNFDLSTQRNAYIKIKGEQP
jgi:hypothetical protein